MWVLGPTFPIRALIRIILSAATNTVKAGSDLKISVVETNLTAHVIELGLIARSNIEVLDSDGKGVKDAAPVVVYHPAAYGKPAWTEKYLDLVGIGSRLIEVQPGQTLKADFVLNKLFD